MKAPWQKRLAVKYTCSRAVRAVCLISGLVLTLYFLLGLSEVPAGIDLSEFESRYFPSAGAGTSNRPEGPVVQANRINNWSLPRDSLSRNASGQLSNLRLLFVTKSKPSNFNRRQLSRSGWQVKARQESRCWCARKDARSCTQTNMVCQYGKMTWAHRFVIGILSLDRVTQLRVGSEVTSNLDFILYPQADSYRRLTWKVLWILKYATGHVHFDYLMLLDDDCFVHLGRINDYLSAAPRTSLYAGHVEENPVSVSRSSWNRWHVDTMAYDSTHYPRYAWGAGLILSSDVVGMTVSAANAWKQPWFGVDDAFMGILLNASGVRVKNVEGIYTGGWYKRLGCRGNYSLRETQPLVVAGDESETLRLISAMEHKKSLCTVLDGPIRDVLLLLTSHYFPAAVVLVVVLAILYAAYSSGYLWSDRTRFSLPCF